MYKVRIPPFFNTLLFFMSFNNMQQCAFYVHLFPSSYYQPLFLLLVVVVVFHSHRRCRRRVCM